MSSTDFDRDKPTDGLCASCRARAEEKDSMDYQPAWPLKNWEGLESSFLKHPAYGAYTIKQSNPYWSKDFHERGLVLSEYALADIFREGMYPFYMHMILLNEYGSPPFSIYTTPGGSNITYLPNPKQKLKDRYEQFSSDLLNFLDREYEGLLEPLGVIYQRWKKVEEILNRRREFIPEIMFLKDSVQTLIGALLRSLIQEYVICIRDRNIRSPVPDITVIEDHMKNFCLVKSIGLDCPKKKAMYDFIKTNKFFLKSKFPENNLDNDHYRTFMKELKPELTKIMRLPS
jgi:hypothetical protein